MKICWLVEKVHPPIQIHNMKNSISRAKFDLKLWNSEWDCQSDLEILTNFNVDTRYIFWGSLNVAKRLYNLHRNIISFCNIGAFACSSFYKEAQQWILNKDWELSTVEKIIGEGPFFIRPDSTMKTFSGRILNKATLDNLDFGNYYEDKNLAVITSSIKSIVDEWRFVVVRGKIITGCKLTADSYLNPELGIATESLRAREFADRAISYFRGPEMVWIVDICKSKNNFYILEANPFSGASLYNCDTDVVINEISSVVM